MKNKEFNPYAMSKELKRKLQRIKLTPKEVKEVNKRDAESKKKRKEWIEWQIKTYGFFESDAADY